MSDEHQEVLRVDNRRRISLGAMARFDFYLAQVHESGQIILTPAQVLPANHPLAKVVDDAIENPGSRIRRNRPVRQQTRE